MSDISRPSASGTTGPAGPGAAGSPVKPPERPPGFGWRVSIRSELAFRLWEAMARLKHAFGRHTFIDVEDWSGQMWTDDRRQVIVPIVAQECWLCPRRV
jgi:hypothetical protein